MTDSWDEDGEVDLATGELKAADAKGPALQGDAIKDALAAVDLTEYVGAAVKRAVAAAVNTAVVAALEAALDEDTLAGIKEQAEAAVQAELHPEPVSVEEDVQEEQPQLLYPTVEAWVTDWLSPGFRRSTAALNSTHRWCSDWWKHGEAVSRLDALWRAWEHLRLDPATGLSVWYRDHCSHHMAVLMDPDGPFANCKEGHKPETVPLPVTPAPIGLFSPH